MPKKLTIEYVREFVRENAQGYTLLSKEYINNRTKLKFKCDKGHIFAMNFSDFKQNVRCSKCANKKRVEKQKLSIAYVKNFIHKNAAGYILLSEEYINNKTHLFFKCPKNHTFKARFDNFLQGSRCPTCSGLKKHMLVNIKQFYLKKNYVFLDDFYKNSSHLHNVLCPKGHKIKKRYNDLQQGYECKKCSMSGTSNLEQELATFIKACTNKKIITNTKKALNGKEIDIYIPDLKLGIEFNGNYWHSSKFLSQQYHQNKSLLAHRKGIKLIHIYEQDWLNKSNKIKKKLYRIIKLMENNKVQLPKNKKINLDYQIHESFQILSKIKPQLINKKYEIYNAGHLLINSNIYDQN